MNLSQILYGIKDGCIDFKDSYDFWLYMIFRQNYNLRTNNSFYASLGWHHYYYYYHYLKFDLYINGEKIL